jgi:amidase
MGGETVGSIVTPSTRNALYALKLTHGSVDTTGVYALSEFFDCVGPMAKSAADVRLMAEILLKRSFDSTKFGTWEGLSVGFLDPRAWTLNEEICPQHEGTAEQMVSGGHVMYIMYNLTILTGRRLRSSGRTPQEKRVCHKLSCRNCKN